MRSPQSQNYELPDPLHTSILLSCSETGIEPEAEEENKTNYCLLKPQQTEPECEDHSLHVPDHLAMWRNTFATSINQSLLNPEMHSERFLNIKTSDFWEVGQI